MCILTTTFAISTVFLRMKDWGIGKYVLLWNDFNNSKAQTMLSYKAKEKIRD